MCGIIGSSVTVVVGAVLLVAIGIVGYVWVPVLIDDMVVESVVLKENTDQFERFENLPLRLQFNVRVWNLTNPEVVLAGGVPVVHELGPYRYTYTSQRLIEDIQNDTIKYRILEHYEFDADASFPFTEDDMITMPNMPFHDSGDLFNFIPRIPEQSSSRNDLFCFVKTPGEGTRVIKIEIYDAEKFQQQQSPICTCQADICAQYVVKNMFDGIYHDVKEVLEKISDNLRNT